MRAIAHPTARSARATGRKRHDLRDPARGRLYRRERRGDGGNASCGGDVAPRWRERAAAVPSCLRIRGQWRL